MAYMKKEQIITQKIQWNNQRELLEINAMV